MTREKPGSEWRDDRDERDLHLEARVLDNREDKYEGYLVNDLFKFRYVVCVIWLMMDPTDELGFPWAWVVSELVGA